MDFPFTANLKSIFIFFFVLTAVLHVLLLKIFKLTAIGWKYTDYVWLSVASLGLLGATAEVRRVIAPAYHNIQEARIEYAYQLVRQESIFLASAAICRTFVPSDLSPKSANFDKVQEEYNTACAYGRQLDTVLPNRQPQSIEHMRLPNSPSVSDLLLTEEFSRLDKLWNEYRDARGRLSFVDKLSQRTEIEAAVSFVSPLLLAAALALRITKVSGEIRLDRQKRLP